MIKYVVLILYAVMIVGVLTLTAKKSLSLNDFLLGGRSVGAWMSALSYGASYFSAVIIVGYAGSMGWQYGIAAAWAGIGNAVIGSLLAWSLLAKPVRRMGERLGVSTIPGFFEKRYNAKWMKLMAAVIIFVFLIPYSASVYKGLGTMFKMALGIDYTWCVIGIAVLAALYLFAGGYKATAITDFIQGIIMIVGVVCLVVAVLSHENVGGLGGLIENLRSFESLPGDPNPTTGSQLTDIFGGSSFKFLCFNIMLTSFGTWGLPQMIGKFYAVKDTSAIKRGTIISTVFCIVIGCGAYLIGSASRLILGGQLPEGGVDSVIPAVLMEVLGGGTFGIILLAVIMILLLSASMSTLEAVVLTSASAVAVDLIPAVRKKETKPQHQMILTRVLCLVFVACSFIFATRNIPIIVSLMSFSWGIVSGCFIGPYIWGLFSKKITKIGAYAGILSGLLTVGGATLVISIQSGFSAAASKSPEMGVAAMAVSMVVVPLVSAFTKNKKEDSERVNEIFACYKED